MVHRNAVDLARGGRKADVVQLQRAAAFGNVGLWSEPPEWGRLPTGSHWVACGLTAIVVLIDITAISPTVDFYQVFFSATSAVTAHVDVPVQRCRNYLELRQDRRAKCQPIPGGIGCYFAFLIHL